MPRYILNNLESENPLKPGSIHSDLAPMLPVSFLTNRASAPVKEIIFSLGLLRVCLYLASPYLKLQTLRCGHMCYAPVERFAPLCSELMVILEALRQPTEVCFTTKSCLDCGHCQQSRGQTISVDNK